MSESDTPADRAYHDELGVVEGEEGDVFVRADGETELLLGQQEALQLAGQLIRVVDGGFEQDVDEGEVRFADMALSLWAKPSGITGTHAELNQDEWIDPGAWAWYSDEEDVALEFLYTSRDGFEIGEVQD